MILLQQGNKLRTNSIFGLIWFEQMTRFGLIRFEQIPVSKKDIEQLTPICSKSSNEI